MPPPAEGIAARLVLGPALRTQPDRRLVTLVREGYESAFEEIIRRYGKPLGRYAAAIVGGRSEDVTQDAFSKALLALRRDDAEIELRPWLFRIVRNTALNELRDSPPSPEVLAESIAGGRNPAEELERREELADLMRRLQALPEPQRAAIVMRELEGLGHEEIAAALGLSGGAARQAIYRARRALRDGAGMLIPLPLLKAILAGPGPSAAEAAAGAAGVGSAAGAGVALKATAATVLVAGALGAGVALDHNPRKDDAKVTPARAPQSNSGSIVSALAAATADDSGSEGEDHRHGQGDDGRRHGRGGSEPNDDHGGRVRESGGGSGRGEGEPGDGPGDHSGSSGHDGETSGQGGDDHSGPSQSGSSHRGDLGSGRGGSGSDGSGPGGDGSGSGDGGDPGPSEESSSGGGPGPSGDSVSGDDSGSGDDSSGSSSGSGSGTSGESDSGGSGGSI
jgi:RNA polymerase sigma factor (sigma-70 family)